MTAFSSRIRRLALAFAVLGAGMGGAAAENAAPPGSRGIGPSGLPLPRFASLASSEVNVRTGPSTDHPIRWVYTRVNLPVRIVEEFDVWRRIEDPDGETGWAHASLLQLRRTVLVRGKEIQELRRSPDTNARVVARVEPGVIGSLVECSDGWCRIEAGGERGWLPKTVLWGVGPED
ncbi:SH3 domain-containing protein [Benzoatithermus flavus]|uniref:SH3 domain-containing protein n=1 Tax=Benzoatithermus flavus TaxID=3108223 RepID=A0ABU8XTH3_9PROT